MSQKVPPPTASGNKLPAKASACLPKCILAEASLHNVVATLCNHVCFFVRQPWHTPCKSKKQNLNEREAVMKKRILKASVVLAIASLLFVLLGWGTPRVATVTAEPLPCFTEGESVVCFDGNPEGNVVCEKLDDNFVLCTSMK
jgi:hypothetical protein